METKDKFFSSIAVEEVMDLIATNVKKGVATIVVAEKSHDSAMNKGRGENRNPFLGRVIVRKTYSGFALGTDYKKSVENTAKRLGNDEPQVTLRENWHEPCALFPEFFSTDKKTKSKVYLKLGRNENQIGYKTTCVYFLDGREATTNEVEEIKRWETKKNHNISSTQLEVGIDAAHEQHFLLPQLDTIVSISCGELTIKVHEALVAASMIYAS